MTLPELAKQVHDNATGDPWQAVVDALKAQWAITADAAMPCSAVWASQEAERQTEVV